MIAPLSLFEDAKYKWDLMIYNMGLSAHPPIVESKNATPKLKEEVQQLNDKYTTANVITSNLSNAVSSLPNFITSNIQMIAIILVMLFIGYIIFKKELKLV